MAGQRPSSTHAPDLASVLRDVLDAAMMAQRAEFGNVQLYDEATGKLEIVAHRGVGPEFLTHFEAVDASDTSACGLALKIGKPVIVEDVTTDPGYAPHRAVAASTGYRGVLCAPMLERGCRRPVGMLTTLFREPYRPSKQDLRLTDFFARQAADRVSSRLVEQRLRDNEEHFRLALEAANMGIWEWDAVTKRIKADKAHQALFGFPPQDEPWPNEIYWERMDSEESVVGTQRAVNAIEAGSDIRLELRVRPSGRGDRWIAVRGRPRTGGSGALIGISYDITDRIKREQALRNDEERLTAILDQIPGAVGLFDAEGQFLLRKGPLAHLWDDIIPSRDPESARRWRSFDQSGRLLPTSQYPGERALRGETVAPGTDFLYSKDKATETWIRVSAAPFRDATGEIRGAVTFLQEIDKEKRAEQRLRESESRLKAAADIVNLGLYSWDPQTNSLVWDATVKAMFGLSEDAPINYEAWRAAVHPDDLERIDDALARCVDPEGDGGCDIEYRSIGIEDGVERWVATRGQTYFVGGKPVAFEGAALDITERKQVESELEERVEARTRQLEEVNAALIAEIEKRRRIGERLNLIQAELFHASRLSVAGQMAAMIAHELSQPLTATLNSVNAARRLLATNEPGRDVGLRELVEDAGTEIERASEIVRRLRFFIRRGSVDRVAEAIAPMVEEAVAFATVGPNALGVTISQYFDPAVPIVLVDRVQIQQVISNIVRNSLEAMKSQTRRELTLATTAGDDGYLELVVSDSGPGVADDMRTDLFEPFKTTKPEGMGLGLSICKSIVEAHGGQISYAPSLDGGATFRITLQTPPGSETG